ncbi:SUKH-3 domain-containing protein [Actinoplanes sp. RD1]|uniref:SUKH-3 domain-containing protein n=1 Tax=Actinoplanes sp. RD1 TaxID=3064538 RepID=UPI0027417B7F|nr:SUKH-3 domain-containing protein [Actinoplanes sp. RD1]
MAHERMLPLAAGALLVGGTVHTHTSIRGDGTPNLHPVLRRLIEELPAGQRERFAGWCAETVLISDRLHDAGADLSAMAARSLLWGAQVQVVHVREDGDPVQGSSLPPCRTCAAVLDHFGMELPEPGVRTVDAPASRDEARAKRWALDLAASRHTVVPAAIEAWSAFGGLAQAAGETGEEVAPRSFVIDPRRVRTSVATLTALGAAVGTPLTPLGEEGDGTGILSIDAGGRVFVSDHTGDWFLGPTVQAALDALSLGRAVDRVKADGTW